MSDIVSEIKSRLSIEDIVSQYVQLKKAGSNFKGLCPFHNEKTPSFMVSPEKELAYCFGCHKGGDMIKFIEEVEGVDFKESVKILADKAGLDPADYQFSTDSGQSKSEKDQLFEIHNVTANFYTDYLWNSDAGKKVLKYLRDRGLTDDTIREFKIGLSPDSFDKTHMHLVKKDFSRQSLVMSGVAITKDTQNSKIYDRFRARLMFPIFNSLGKIVGFGGRALKKEEKAKYLNSPDSPIYRKGEVLYGYNYAKDAIKKKGNIILVEGYFDVIMSYQIGAKNVAATSGTALTLEQIKLIKRLTRDCLFCFDTDKAGIEAAKRGFELAQQEEMNVNVIDVPGEKDPADYVLHNGEKWIETIENKKPFMDFVIKEIISHFDVKSIEGKKKLLEEIIHYLYLLTNSIEKDHYIREIARKIDVKEVKIYDEMKKVRKHSAIKPTESVLVSKKKKENFTIMEIVLGLIYEHSEILKPIFDKIDEKYLNEGEKSIYFAFKDHYNSLRTRDEKKDFLLCLDDEIRSRVEIIAFFVDDKHATFSDEMLLNECEILMTKAKKDVVNKEKKELSAQLREAEKQGDSEEAKRLLEKFNILVSK